MPIAAALLLPPSLDLWVGSKSLNLPVRDAFQEVIAHYSRGFGESLWITTGYQLPPFIILAAILTFLTRRISLTRLAALSVSGLTLILIVQIPLTIRIFEDIPEGEAEFVQFRYIGNSLLSILLLSCLFFPLIPWNSAERESA